ncbi:hypothetical protein ACFL3T_00170 [Patescibacteria group bacterium]
MAKPIPDRTPHQGSQDALKSQRKGKHVETIRMAKTVATKQAAQALKQLKRDMTASTLNARETGKGISGDRKSLIHQRIFDQFEAKMKAYNKQHALAIDKKVKELTARGFKWNDIVNKIKELNLKYKKHIFGLEQSIAYAFRALAGSNKKLEGADYATFQTLFDNISDAYNKNNDFRKTIINIAQGNLNKKDWDMICASIKKYKLRKNVSKDKDRLSYNITALLFRLMDQNQRYQAVLEYAKRNSKAEGARFAESLVMSDVLNIKQYEELMKELKGKNYTLSSAREAEIKLSQLQVRKMREYVRKRLASPMLINGAERMLNRTTIAGGIITGIGILGMISNYMAHFNTTKGAGRFVAGLKSPYFMFGALVTAAGAHITGKGMTAGKHGVGLANRFIPQPKRLNNPFGVGKSAESKDKYFDELVAICKDHRILERWLLNEQGFDDLNGFYRKKNYDLAKIKSDALEPESTRKDKRPLIEQFIAYQESRGNKKGAMMIRRSIKAYGKQPTQQYIVRLIAIGAKVGLPTSRSFNKMKVRGQNFTYHQLLLHKQGVKSIPRSDLPAVRAKAAAAAAKAAKAKAAKPSTSTTP